MRTCDSGTAISARSRKPAPSSRRLSRRKRYRRQHRPRNDYADGSALGNIGDAQLTVRNPLPAAGGVDPEPISQVKLLAPNAYQTELLRAITKGDYVELAQAVPGVFQAAAVRCAGPANRTIVRVAIDPVGTESVSKTLLERVAARLEEFREIGHDVEVTGAKYVPLDIEMLVRVLPDYLRGHVEMELSSSLRYRNAPERKARDVQFAEPWLRPSIYQSKLIAAAQSVTGVQDVSVLRLARLLDEAGGPVPDMLTLGPLEVAQLDNDPSAPRRGRLHLRLVGGR